MNPAEATSNLCAQVPTTLLAKIREEQEKAGLSRGEYITQILTSYYENQDRKGENNMTLTKTLAFQVSEEFYERIKDHLDRETRRTGKKLTQRSFVIGLIEQALDEAEQRDCIKLGEEDSESGEEAAV